MALPWQRVPLQLRDSMDGIEKSEGALSFGLPFQNSLSEGFNSALAKMSGPI
jgi:hypothetical protein